MSTIYQFTQIPLETLSEYKDRPLFPFLQSNIYLSWQVAQGRRVEVYRVTNEQGALMAVCALIVFPFMKWNYGYIPYGPVIFDSSLDMSEVVKFLRGRAQSLGLFFTRIDSTYLTGESKQEQVAGTLVPPAFTYLSAAFQPRTEWLLPLSKSTEEIFKSLHEKTRYGIRNALRHGVESEIITDQFEVYFEDFYRLMSETGARNGFLLHPREYYQSIFKTLPGNGFLSVARINGALHTIHLYFIFGTVAHFVFGGSDSSERKANPPYAAHWNAIEESHRRGLTAYNFGAIDETPGSKYESLTYFKKKFGGYALYHTHAGDIVLRYPHYAIFLLRRLQFTLRDSLRRTLTNLLSKKKK
jgi:lipid II:glycine glycyltransferase (peptidoglycan interpeptide bridge formation enzyme)